MPNYHETPPPRGGEVLFRDKHGNICTGIMFPDGTPVRGIDLPLSLIRIIAEAAIPLIEEDIRTGRFPK